MAKYKTDEYVFMKRTMYSLKNHMRKRLCIYGHKSMTTKITESDSIIYGLIGRIVGLGNQRELIELKLHKYVKYIITYQNQILLQQQEISKLKCSLKSIQCCILPKCRDEQQQQRRPSELNAETQIKSIKKQLLDKHWQSQGKQQKYNCIDNIENKIYKIFENKNYLVPLRKLLDYVLRLFTIWNYSTHQIFDAICLIIIRGLNYHVSITIIPYIAKFSSSYFGDFWNWKCGNNDKIFFGNIDNKNFIHTESVLLITGSNMDTKSCVSEDNIVGTFTDTNDMNNIAVNEIHVNICEYLWI